MYIMHTYNTHYTLYYNVYIMHYITMYERRAYGQWKYAKKMCFDILKLVKTLCNKT